MTPILADTIFWVAAAACVAAQAGILRATFRRAEPSVTAPATPVRRRATRIEELAWAVLPVLALAGTLLLTWRALHPTVVSHVAPAAQTAGAAA